MKNNNNLKDYQRYGKLVDKKVSTIDITNPIEDSSLTSSSGENEEPEVNKAKGKRPKSIKRQAQEIAVKFVFWILGVVGVGLLTFICTTFYRTIDNDKRITVNNSKIEDIQEDITKEAYKVNELDNSQQELEREFDSFKNITELELQYIKKK